MKYLVVGLGNIGAEYADTRHNIGFRVLDALAEASNISFMAGRYGSTTTLRHKGRQILLLKPSTYMNLSGKAVRYWMEQEKIPIENILIISDDISLPFGQLRMRKKGSAGGHNGLKSIIAHLSSEEFPRVKIGVGKKPNPEYDLVDWVLGKFSADDRKLVEECFEKAYGAIELIVKGEIEKAMCAYN